MRLSGSKRPWRWCAGWVEGPTAHCLRWRKVRFKGSAYKRGMTHAPWIQRHCHHRPHPQVRRYGIASIALALACAAAPAWALTPADMLAGYAQAAGQAPQVVRGQQFFDATHGKEWRCSTCHTKQPTAEGTHASTRKAITPLAPSANPKRFTDSAKTEKWFRRNCNDVLGRECTAAEKADVLAWLLSLKP